MRKLLKLFSVLFIMLGVIFTLAGCGDDKSSSSKEKNSSNAKNEVVNVSKEKVLRGEYIRGDVGYTSEMEMTFSENDRLTKLVLIYDCATEEDAQRFYKDSQKDIEGTTTEMKIDGKKVTITMDAEDYMKMSGLTEDKLNEGTMRQVANGMGYDMKTVD